MDRHFRAFNQLSTEIIILNKNLDILIMNESAASNGWTADLIDNLNIFKQIINKEDLDSHQIIPLAIILEENSLSELQETLSMAKEKASAITIRDMMLSFKASADRAVDLTVTFSSEFDVMAI
jgi:hypothetical protein